MSRSIGLTPSKKALWNYGCNHLYLVPSRPHASIVRSTRFRLTSGRRRKKLLSSALIFPLPKIASFYGTSSGFRSPETADELPKWKIIAAGGRESLWSRNSHSASSKADKRFKIVRCRRRNIGLGLLIHLTDLLHRQNIPSI